MVHLRIFTSDQVLVHGLQLVGFDETRQARVKKETNIEDFKAHYGVHPFVIATIWEELQTTTVQEARIYPTLSWVINGMVTMKNFLHMFHFLKRYQTESEQKGVTGYCQTTLQRWTWFFVKKLRALEAIKIVWPQDHEWGETTFIISVDGVNFRFHEEKHPTLSKNPDIIDHKSNSPGLSYELALDVWKSRLVWAKRKPKTKDNNRKFFVRIGGLQSKIPAGKKAITDQDYRGKEGDDKVATPNSFDHPLLKEFKACTPMRQESFNQRIEWFGALTAGHFVHSKDQHEDIFFAVCVICCYEMELVSPLFDV